MRHASSRPRGLDASAFRDQNPDAIFAGQLMAAFSTAVRGRNPKGRLARSAPETSGIGPEGSRRCWGLLPAEVGPGPQRRRRICSPDSLFASASTPAVVLGLADAQSLSEFGEILRRNQQIDALSYGCRHHRPQADRVTG